LCATKKNQQQQQQRNTRSSVHLTQTLYSNIEAYNTHTRPEIQRYDFLLTASQHGNMNRNHTYAASDLPLRLSICCHIRNQHSYQLFSTLVKVNGTTIGKSMLFNTHLIDTELYCSE